MSTVTISQDADLWDRYTLKDEYGDRVDGFRAIYAGADCARVRDPAVSRYLAGSGVEFEYPGGKPFAVCLTHDVDDLYPTSLHRIASLGYHLKGLDLAGLKKDISPDVRGEGAYTYVNFREIMDIEERYGAKSSFYFMCTDRDILNRIYNVEEIGPEVRHIADRGWEVGLHGGYYAYNDISAIRREKARLEQVLGEPVTGYRNHYLCFQVPDTWEILARAGFRYDTTLGYSNVAGFRNGLCHPFRPYHRNSGRAVDIVEIPLALMDCTLFKERSLARAWDISRHLIDVAERYNGVITINWHNIIFSTPFRAPWKALYHRILGYCREKNAWMTSAEEIARTPIVDIV